ncbi:hypothetical protein NYE69_26110 [Paenibacillus sp. FSL R5-0527]|uniref:hypothetical protein n=1 Tax=Paenibacillus sp. FSL R5-0527 TaxID=2975321 RepID=UPI00097A26EB|nr:hypothetical protein BK140_10230 [Paenibacillus macerans]
MSKIHLNELLPDNFNRVTKIYNGTELLFVYELGKYSKLLLGKELDLSNVTIEESIKNSEYFSFVVYNGLNVGGNFEKSKLVAFDERKFFTESVEGVVFKKENENEVIYDFHYDVVSNSLMNDSFNKSAAYISLVAFIIVKRVRDRIKIPRIVIDHANYLPQRFEYVDLQILMTYGNKLLDGIVEFPFKQKENPYDNFFDMMRDFVDNKLKVHFLNLDWLAFVMHNRQLGTMNRSYGMKEKYQYLRGNFEIGDVVLLYERVNVKKSDPGDLISCYPAVLREFGEDYLTLEYYPIIRSKVTQYVIHNSFNALPKESRMAKNVPTNKVTKYDGIVTVLEDKELRFENDSYFISRVEKLHLLDIGIDTSTYMETRFFIKPIEVLEGDGSKQYLATELGIGQYWLSTLDTIYLIFEEHKVDYNKERFRKLYYESFNREPGYSIKELQFWEWNNGIR